MFNPTEVVIDAFVERLQQAYTRTFGGPKQDYAEIIGWAGRMALENIANSDALYHNTEHTIMVTMVGLEIVDGKHLREGGVRPEDWLNYTISLLCHDMGYVRGVLRGDSEGAWVINAEGETVSLPQGATDAALTPWHVERGRLFVHERFGGHPVIDAAIIADNIGHTRFPVPEGEADTGGSFSGLVRAADLIGQMADPNYTRKLSALYREFEETGADEKLGYTSPYDLRVKYPGFFWTTVYPYIDDALRYLRATQEGRQWIANLYANVFTEEHRMAEPGPERGV